VDKEGNERVEWTENNEIKAKDLIFFLTESINEGIDIENEKNREKRKLVTTRQVGRIISELGSGKILEKVVSVLRLAEGVQGEEVDEKN